MSNDGDVVQWANPTGIITADSAGDASVSVLMEL